MEVVSYHSCDFVYIDSWGFVVWDFKKTYWRCYIAELTFYIFGECNKASNNIWTFPRVLVPDTYIGKKKNNIVYLCTSLTMLTLHRNDGMEPKRCLAYATEIADFYRMQIVAKKILGRRQNGRVGRVSGNNTFFFFFCGLSPKMCRKNFENRLTNICLNRDFCMEKLLAREVTIFPEKN